LLVRKATAHQRERAKLVEMLARMFPPSFLYNGGGGV